MALRITTWNVNGIRNPFGYQPWRDKRSFAAMFDVLEADIVIFQETKIQRKDLSDDMVLVPGWDCYFSLPKYKKGYSGVVIYTRQSVCAPIRAEEGITGVLCPPNSSVPFSQLPSGVQIGGYPTPAQLSTSLVDANTLDSEGRAVILEFPAFVLLGVYNPANSDGSRDDFRQGFLDVLDARVRNLDSLGKRVVLAGDLNISRDELDVANADAHMRKQGLTGYEYVSTPARRMLNQLLQGGKVFGERDPGRADPVLFDLCRSFHPSRKANCGARIDYILCSLSMQDWFSASNIQEGLMGSDHCPVFAVLQEKVKIGGHEYHARDLMNPSGVFVEGDRQRDYAASSDLLLLSGRLIPEFSGRRSIRDMFSQKRSMNEKGTQNRHDVLSDVPIARAPQATLSNCAIDTQQHSSNNQRKRSSHENSAAGAKVKRVKPSVNEYKTQKNLRTFFQAQRQDTAASNGALSPEFNSPLPRAAFASSPAKSFSGEANAPEAATHPTNPTMSQTEELSSQQEVYSGSKGSTSPKTPILEDTSSQSTDIVHDPVQTMESWSKLFTKPIAPRCEGHDEPCISLLTKKPGLNLGRSFWMCPRPLGPSGAKERNTQWRCQSFIWCSDWNTRSD